MVIHDLDKEVPLWIFNHLQRPSIYTYIYVHITRIYIYIYDLYIYIYIYMMYIYMIYIYILLYNIPMLSPVDSPERPSWTLASVPRTSETSPGCIARATASNSWISSLENPWGIMEPHGTFMEHYGKMIDKCLKSWEHYFISSNVMKIPLKSMAVLVGALDLNSIYLVYPGRVCIL